MDAINSCQNNPLSSNKDLSSLLILPIQRVPRYVLFLEKLKKLTPTDHPHYHSIAKSLVGITEIASLVNERKKEADNKVCINININTFFFLIKYQYILTVLL